MVRAALLSLRSSGDACASLPEHWRRAVVRLGARSLGECVTRGECAGGVICSATTPAWSAASPTSCRACEPRRCTTVAQAARATLTLGANLLAVEMPGRTYFELRQMLRLLCATVRLPDQACRHPAGAGRPCASLR